MSGAETEGRAGFWTPAVLAHRWWADIETDRATRARLRRAHDIDAIALEPATGELHRRLRGGTGSYQSPEAYLRTALVAGVLACVRADMPRLGFATALGLPTDGGDTPVMSAIRAERLRRSRTPDAALDPFRRAVALLGGRADVRDLAGYLIDWCDDRAADARRSRADSARIRFAFAYHGAASAAPHNANDTMSEETAP